LPLSRPSQGVAEVGKGYVRTGPAKVPGPIGRKLQKFQAYAAHLRIRPGTHSRRYGCLQKLTVPFQVMRLQLQMRDEKNAMLPKYCRNLKERDCTYTRTTPQSRARSPASSMSLANPFPSWLCSTLPDLSWSSRFSSLLSTKYSSSLMCCVHLR
jgi:hypothetical protein